MVGHTHQSVSWDLEAVFHSLDVYDNWMGDRLGLPGAVYTRTSCSDVVSWDSENHINQMARLTDFDLDVKEPQWT